MGADTSTNWEDYYRKIQGRELRPLLLDVVERFENGRDDAARQAIDLGCGDGTETAELIRRGWSVLAIDGEPAAIAWLLKKIPPGHQDRLRTQVARFEEVTLVPADLLYAGYSIPFCPPDAFGALWAKIEDAVRPAGRFAGQFFGVNDTWADNPDWTFHTEAQVRDYLTGWQIEYFHERDEDGDAADGPKHWHVFTVIARKP